MPELILTHMFLLLKGTYRSWEMQQDLLLAKYSRLIERIIILILKRTL